MTFGGLRWPADPGYSSAKLAGALFLGLLVMQIHLLRFLPKYLPWLSVPSGLIAAAIAVLAAAIAISLAPRKLNWLDQPWPALLLLAAYIVVAAIGFPYEYALRFQGRGSDQADCVVVVASNLLNGTYPYHHSFSYLQDPCSPGLGEAFLYAPFVLAHGYQFGAPVCLILASFLIKRFYRSWFPVNMFLILLSGSEYLWEGLVAGTDFILIGAGFAAICAFLQAYDGAGRRDGFALPALAVFSGFIISSRLPLTFMAIAIGALLWPRSRRDSLVFVGMALATAGLLFALPYFWSPDEYTPLHLARRAHQYTEDGRTALRAAAALLAPIAAALLLSCLRRPAPLLWPAAIAACLLAPMALAAIGNLYWVNLQLVAWEGPNYLMIGEPTLAFALALAVMRRHRERDVP